MPKHFTDEHEKFRMNNIDVVYPETKAEVRAVRFRFSRDAEKEATRGDQIRKEPLYDLRLLRQSSLACESSPLILHHTTV
jgi:hypothetical protein